MKKESSPLPLTDKKLEELWEELGDVPIDNDECIEQDFYDFTIGTDREDIWHWFDILHSKGVYYLMYNKGIA